MKVVGVLACTMLLIPSANAVDALKTCTCLLKECRYSLHPGSNVFHITLCLGRKMIASGTSLLLAHVIKNFQFSLLYQKSVRTEFHSIHLCVVNFLKQTSAHWQGSILRKSILLIYL